MVFEEFEILNLISLEIVVRISTGHDWLWFYNLDSSLVIYRTPTGSRHQERIEGCFDVWSSKITLEDSVCIGSWGRNPEYTRQIIGLWHHLVKVTVKIS